MNFYNLDFCEHFNKIPKESVDLIIADPPFGINEKEFDKKHYNRKEINIIPGYVDIPLEKYNNFTFNWIRKAEILLNPNGSMYVISGWTNLQYILNALQLSLKLKIQNHIIWKYNFGVYTKNKFVTSHYHILYCVPMKEKYTFNRECRLPDKRTENKNLNYLDREDVWFIKRKYKPNQKKYKNQLPEELVNKMISYSSNPGDLVFDPFLGSFTTAVCAKKLKRRTGGFEINPHIYKIGVSNYENTIVI